MSITGKVVGAIIGLLLFKSPWGALIGAIIGHFYDQSVNGVRRTSTGGGAGVLEIGERFFTATFGREAIEQVSASLAPLVQGGP